MAVQIMSCLRAGGQVEFKPCPSRNSLSQDWACFSNVHKGMLWLAEGWVWKYLTLICFSLKALIV